MLSPEPGEAAKGRSLGFTLPPKWGSGGKTPLKSTDWPLAAPLSSLEKNPRWQGHGMGWVGQVA